MKLFNLTSEFTMGYHSYYIPELFENENQPPLKPSYLSGPSSGRILTEQNYSFKTYDTEGDSIYYMLDWGDGTDSGWLGPYDSGEEQSATHIWVEQGNYQIKVKAKDSYDAESEWSDPLPISMPKTYALRELLLSKLFDVIAHLLNRAIL